MKPSFERLPDAEYDVMQIIWQSEQPLKTSVILSRLHEEQGKDWNISTLQSLLTRLQQRGYIDFKNEGRLKLYYPLIDQQSYTEQETQSFFSRFHRNSYKSLFAALTGGRKISRESLDELSEIVRNAGKEDD
ncbi:BlaI/MecI/CopY family transcriptional regulator [Paenibacillus sp. J2TS4]|uniref:BlaI/MecI/CopY family transcriptional regulator n=1 Tax=Paenibacillus sp. J2TS4 TaxID=2807194 RepID=UPI001B203F67|nr:BlaI/MecI/CopY family transcriptional regulator [Paenibacillus sp. J2TS4]GIP32022.1 transcriptional regulator [Paenibacillus sp. J2TS4]